MKEKITTYFVTEKKNITTDLAKENTILNHTYLAKIHDFSF